MTVENSIEAGLGAAIQSGEVVLLVGSGVSIPDYPSWIAVLSEFLDDADGRSLISSKNDKALILDQISKNPLEAADLIESLFGRNQFRSILSKRFQSIGRFTPLHRAVFDLNPRLILTTNYDDGLEQAFSERNKKPPLCIRQTDDANLLGWRQGNIGQIGLPPILHWHGLPSDPENMIFTSTDYHRMYSNIGASSFLADIWRDKALVVIGFGFADPFLTRLKIRENGATSGAGVLAVYGYDDLGRKTSVTRGNGASTTYGYDAADRLTSLSHDLAGTTGDLSQTFAYNTASQVNSLGGSNTSYTPTLTSTSLSYGVNGLNQLTTAGTASLSYDTKGNLSSDGTHSYGYDAYNNLTSLDSNAVSYDPAGRLAKTVGSATTQFEYDGSDLIAEYNGSGTMLRRYVHGPGTDEPIVWYEGSGTTDRRWLVADRQGSIIAVTDSSGAASTVNTYDPYGVPGSSNAGRFQYAGQVWVPEEGLYHYKARAYSPLLGRFLQTDPIGYADGANWYAAMHGDPVNGRDTSGTEDITVWGRRPDYGEIIKNADGNGSFAYNGSGPTVQIDPPAPPQIIPVANTCPAGTHFAAPQTSFPSDGPCRGGETCTAETTPNAVSPGFSNPNSRYYSPPINTAGVGYDSNGNKYVRYNCVAVGGRTCSFVAGYGQMGYGIVTQDLPSGPNMPTGDVNPFKLNGRVPAPILNAAKANNQCVPN